MLRKSEKTVFGVWPVHLEVSSWHDHQVKIHQAAGSDASDAVSYDVSVKVGDTIYVVLYTPPLGEETVKYAAGRDLLVLLGKRSIRYNDIWTVGFRFSGR